MTTDGIIILVIQIFTIIGYFVTARLQTKKIETLESNLSSQSNLLKNQADTISTFEDYKKMVNLTDVEKNINLKIENLHLEYKKIIELNNEKMIVLTSNKASEVFAKEHTKLLRALNEFITSTASIIIDMYPDSKSERDDMALKLLPYSHDYLIGYMEALMNGSVHSYKANHPLDEILSNDNIQEDLKTQTPKPDQTVSHNRQSEGF